MSKSNFDICFAILGNSIKNYSFEFHCLFHCLFVTCILRAFFDNSAKYLKIFEIIQYIYILQRAKKGDKEKDKNLFINTLPPCRDDRI